MTVSSKIAVVVYGPPGSGKGTQAELLAKKLDLIHFDTGRYLERVVYDSKNRRDPAVLREKMNFTTGKLMTPSWVFKVVGKRTRAIAEAGWGLVFSGSPRTVFEAFEADGGGLYRILDKLYGRKNIFIFKLNVKAGTSIERNSGRLVCSNCGQPVMSFYKSAGNLCPFCAAPLRKRSLDKPDIIKVRLKEYENRTNPIFKKLKQKGYRIHNIDGEAPAYKVSEKILKIILKSNRS